MDYASLLNEKQLEAVETSAQYVRIIAGAGSGKTRVLTYRISYLISDRHVDPGKILAIAFTNKVATEMKDRASKLVFDLLGYTPNLHISTFHSFCARFLRTECHSIGYPVGFTIYDEDDQQRLVKSLAEPLGYKKGDEMVKKALAYIREQKLYGRYPEDITIGKDSYPDEKECYKFYQQYELKKQLGFALDFDDLLLKTIEILSSDAAIRTKWSHRFDHILVDEFQDTNDVQYKLMRLLERPDTNVYVVGDPDQTIYTWRGANQNIILNFEKTHSPLETVILNENYRSTKTILDTANKLIAHNKKRVPKDLFTKQGKGDPIEIKVLMSPEKEAEWVGRQIKKLADANVVEGEPYYKNIAILYRSSYMTRPFESELKDLRIPFKIYGGQRFYERAEVKDLLAYFNLLLNPADNVSFERIINVPRRGVGDVSVTRLQSEAAAANVSEYQYMSDIASHADDSEIPTRVITSLTSLIAKMEETKKKLKENVEAYSAVLKDFTTDIGYLQYIVEDQDPEEDRLGNVNALFDDITHFLVNNPDSTFAEYLQNVALLTSQDDMKGGNVVSLMTVHVAKGLEFDNVFVIGLQDGAFPSQRAEMDTGRDGLEEERRLAYVAFTRAKKKLYLSCNTAYSYVTDSHMSPSRFYKEAGLEVPDENNWSNGSGYDSWGHTPGYTPSQQYFADGDSISPFDEKKEEPEVEKPTDNGIRDWHVGDRAHHEKFGDGDVVEIIDKNIVIVNFDTAGKKTLLATHPMLSRIKSKGGEA